MISDPSNPLLTPWGSPNDIVWAPDGRTLACAADDGAVHLVDVQSGAELSALGDHDVDEVTAADFAPGGAVIASTDLSSTVYLWSVRTGTALGQLTHEHGGHFLAYIADGRYLVAAGLDETCALIDVEAMKVETALRSKAGELRRIAISADRRVLAVLTAHDRVVAWDLTTRTELERARAPEGLSGTCLAVSPDGSAIAIGTQDGHLITLPLDGSGARACVAAHDGPVRFLAFAPAGDLIASAGPDQLVRLWQRSGLAPAGFRTTAGPAGLLAFSPDGRRIAADDGAGELKVWAREPAGFAAFVS